MWNGKWVDLIWVRSRNRAGWKASEPCVVRSEEHTSEEVERNVWEECTGRGLGQYVTDWVFKKEGSEWDEQGWLVDGEGADETGVVVVVVLQESNQVVQKRVKMWRRV